MARWSRIAAALALCLLLTGCPAAGAGRPTGNGAAGGPLHGAAAGGGPSGGATVPDPAELPVDPGAAPSTPAAVEAVRLPPYQGPPTGGPPSAGPLTTVRAAVHLPPGPAGTSSLAEQVTAAPGGGAYVSLAPDDGGGDRRLVTLGRSGSALTVLRSVATPGERSVWGLYRWTGGRVLVAGRVGALGPGQGGYGFDVVDPASGVVRQEVVVPYAVGTTFSFGRSALSADGRTLYLFVSVDLGPVADERLLAVDVATGAIRIDRPLAPDLSPVTLLPAGDAVAGLVPRPRGGVTLVFDAMPAASPLQPVPTVLSYDVALRPVGSAVHVLERADGARTRAVATTADGTVFLCVQVAQEAWLLAIADRGGAGPVLAQVAKSRYDDALVVEPAQVWGLMPSPAGARAIDLTDGALGPPVDLGCAWQDVQAIAPGSDGSALVVGACISGATRTQMLWVVGH